MSKQEKILEKVRALLAKADSTNFAGEADVFRAKADELMLQYAIEAWQLETAAAGRPEPEVREFDFGWYEKSPLKTEIFNLWRSTLSHCRVVDSHTYYGDKIQIVGLPSDLGYFDLLLTSLLLEMSKGLELKPDPEQSYIENLVALKESGMKWERIGELLYGIGQLDKPYTRNTGTRFTKEYARYCAENGREQMRTSPIVYQRSYADGFQLQVALRFRAMRKAQEDREMGEKFMSGDNSFALVVLDIQEAVRDFAKLTFGEREGKGRSLSSSSGHSSAAYGRGSEAGRKANISSKADRGLKNRKALAS